MKNQKSKSAILSVLVFGFLSALVFGCSTVKYVPVETVKEIHTRDSIYFRDTLIRIELEKARLSDFVDVGDTLVLSTDLARSTAFVDTTAGKLKGSIENIKPYAEKPVPVGHKIEYRDSIITKEVPVEVEKIVKKVPLMTKILAWIGGIFLLISVGYIVSKFI